MAENSAVTDIVQRAIDANIRYYEALGRVTRDYWQAVFAMVRDAPSLFSQFATRAAAAAQPAARTSPPPSSPASLVLEGAKGEEPSAVFMVNNHLKRTVAAPVVTSLFANASGRVARPLIRLAPSVVTLEPGAHALVQITVIISDELEPEVAYRGDVSVPGLSDHRIPVLIRRREEAAPEVQRRDAEGTTPNDSTSSSATRRRSGRARRGKKG